MNNSLEIKKYEFSENVFVNLQDKYFAKDLWPIVYILSDDKIKKAYVGETTDTYARVSSHLSNDSKNKLEVIHLISIC